MIIDSREYTLKNGQKINLRSPLPEDTKELVQHRIATSLETYFMSRYPEEFQDFEESQRRTIMQICELDDDFELIALIGGKVVGHAGIRRIENHLKTRHRGMFGISIQQEFAGLGLGSLMLGEALEIAKDTAFEQIELGVFADNVKAIHLYEKFGFEQVGIMPRAFKLKDGTYRDEVQMVRFI